MFRFALAACLALATPALARDESVEIGHVNTALTNLGQVGS